MNVLVRRKRTGMPPAKGSIWAVAFVTALLAILVLGVVPNSFGQGITGSITGTVTDSSGAWLAGATVTIRQVDTNAIRTVTTSDVGSYTVTQLMPGIYTVKVEKAGFAKFQQNNITLAITMNAPFAATGAFGANPSVMAQHSTITPYTEQYNLAIEHQLQKGLDVRVGYVGQRNIHQNNFGGPGNTAPDINLPPPAPGVVQTRRPVQPFSSINLNFAPIFHSTMNALQVGVHKQYSHGFMINAEYSWSRVLGVENFENPATIGDSYGNISTNTPQVLEVSYSYMVPFGRGQLLFGQASNMVNKFIGGWQLSGITSFQTGQPFSVTYTAPGSPVGLVSGRADRVPGVPLYLKHKTRKQWFNPAAFTAPQSFTYGNSGYNRLWGPHYQNWDMNLEKNTTWRERYTLKLRADAFNVFNHPNFAAPTAANAAVSNPTTFGTITSSIAENRTIEFGMKFGF
jgi:Carboxypeptidase regulatory-like domain